MNIQNEIPHVIKTKESSLKSKHPSYVVNLSISRNNPKIVDGSLSVFDIIDMINTINNPVYKPLKHDLSKVQTRLKYNFELEEDKEVIELDGKDTFNLDYFSNIKILVITLVDKPSDYFELTKFENLVYYKDEREKSFYEFSITGGYKATVTLDSSFEGKYVITIFPTSKVLTTTTKLESSIYQIQIKGD